MKEKKEKKSFIVAVADPKVMNPIIYTVAGLSVLGLGILAHTLYKLDC